jgi:uncharacterized protein
MYWLTKKPVWVAMCLMLVCSLSYAQNIEFPELTGRVVDRAGMIDAAAEQQLTALLEAHENATTNQLVVVTLKDLQGYPIEQFGYQLGRAWGIGQKGEDNGALLLVAEAERAVRIEVGYGLEGELTDAISSNIVHSVILPAFRQGKFSEGISNGAQAMVQAVGGEYKMRSTKAKPTDTGGKALILLLVFGGWLALASITSIGGGRGSGRGLLLLGALGVLGGGRGGFGGGGGGFGGGFSGGGGGFGGGGASGGW